jgi:hypothetical protein
MTFRYPDWEDYRYPLLNPAEKTWPIDGAPDAEKLKCPACSRPMRLLIQLYAPTEVEDILRIIYVFICKDGRCQKPGFSPAYRPFQLY